MTRDISRLIEAVNRVGVQNISLLSRMTGMPTETIRYTMRRRFPKLGLTVEMPVNHSALGLERNFVTMRLAEGAKAFDKALVKALAEKAFLTYACNAPIERRLVTYFSVPVSLTDEFHAFLDATASSGVLADYSVERLEWSRHPELRSKDYNFATGQWSVDWDKVGKDGEAPPAYEDLGEPSPSPEIDYTDLLIIKELQLDSWRNIAEIARKLKLNERTVRWHYKKHVAAMAGSNYVNWVPVTPREFKRAVGLVHEFKGVSKRSLARLRVLFNNFPFCWFEAGRSDGYYQVSSAMPAGYLMESLRFLNARLDEVAGDWKMWTVDLSTAHPHTIPYQNFDESKGWFFDKEMALKAVVPQALKIDG